MNVIRKVRRALRRDGIVGTIALCIRNLRPVHHDLAPSAFDLEYGIDTSGVVELGDLEIESASSHWGHAYHPTPDGIFTHILALLPPPDRFVFVDLGAGKGRVVLMAAREQYRAVVGVEFSPELCRVAEANLEKFKPHVRAGSAQMVCADAGEYEFAPGPLIVFFYHAFGKEVLARVVERLYRRTDETLFVYYNPHFQELFSRAAVVHDEPGLCIWTFGTAPAQLNSEDAGQSHLFRNTP